MTEAEDPFQLNEEKSLMLLTTPDPFKSELNDILKGFLNLLVSLIFLNLDTFPEGLFHRCSVPFIVTSCERRGHQSEGGVL